MLEPRRNLGHRGKAMQSPKGSKVLDLGTTAIAAHAVLPVAASPRSIKSGDSIVA